MSALETASRSGFKTSVCFVSDLKMLAEDAPTTDFETDSSVIMSMDLSGCQMQVSLGQTSLLEILAANPGRGGECFSSQYRLVIGPCVLS